MAAATICLSVSCSARGELCGSPDKAIGPFPLELECHDILAGQRSPTWRSFPRTAKREQSQRARHMSAGQSGTGNVTSARVGSGKRKGVDDAGQESSDERRATLAQNSEGD